MLVEGREEFQLHSMCYTNLVYIGHTPFLSSGVLVQPQWKHFRHIQMLKNDRIRLSNGIWRSWHLQCECDMWSVCVRCVVCVRCGECDIVT